jgi:hypothetical protein
MNQQSQSSDTNLNMQHSSQQWYQQTIQRIYPQSPPYPDGQQGPPEVSDAYIQGYHAQKRATPLTTQESGPSDPLYEEPQATYPEMTQKNPEF